MAPQELTSLHGLKTFLIFFLCLHHIAYAFLIINDHSHVFEIAGFDFYPLFVNGWVSIEFFYGICGFYAAHYFLSQPQRRYRDYALYISLVFLPLYYLILLASVMEWFPHFQVPFENNAFSHFYHVFMLSDVFMPSNNVMLGTMAVEFKFLLFAPLLVFLVMRYQNQKRALVIVTASLVIIGIVIRGLSYSKLQLTDHYHMDYFMFFMYCRMAFIYVMDPMLIGMVLAFFYQGVTEGKVKSPSSCMAKIVFHIGILGLLIWSAAVDHFDVHTYYDALFQPLVTASIFGLILYGCLFDGAPKWFSGQIACYFSKRAFGVYLIHIPLVQFSYNMGVKTALYLGLPLTEMTIIVMFFIVNMVLSLCATEILYRILEKPIQKYAAKKQSLSA